MHRKTPSERRTKEKQSRASLTCFCLPRLHPCLPCSPLCASSVCHAARHSKATPRRLSEWGTMGDGHCTERSRYLCVRIHRLTAPWTGELAPGRLVEVFEFCCLEDGTRRVRVESRWATCVSLTLCLTRRQVAALCTDECGPDHPKYAVLLPLPDGAHAGHALLPTAEVGRCGGKSKSIWPVHCVPQMQSRH